MSTWRRFGVCAVLAVLLAATCGPKPDATPVPPVYSPLPGCQAALAAPDYGNALTVSAEAKAAIESYRTSWKAFCAEGAAGKPSMADLLVKAKEIQALFSKVIDAHNNSRNTAQRYSHADAVSDLLVKKYPTFVPAFEGSYYEQEYFRPATVEFKKHARLGTVEDQRFFDAGIMLNTEFPEWMDRTWHLGGCWRHGEFDWSAELDKVTKLQKDLKTGIYKELTSEHEAALMEPLVSEENSICACNRKDAVSKDLQRMLDYLAKTPALASYEPRVRSKLNKVQAGQIAVDSEAEKHCSGG